jgi:hypothetical protein
LLLPADVKQSQLLLLVGMEQCRTPTATKLCNRSALLLLLLLDVYVLQFCIITQAVLHVFLHEIH